MCNFGERHRLTSRLGKCTTLLLRWQYGVPKVVQTPKDDHKINSTIEGVGA